MSSTSSSARPYFGALEKLSRQINDVVRPRHLDTFTRLAEQIRQVVRPSYLDRINETIEQIQRAITPAAVDRRRPTNRCSSGSRTRSLSRRSSTRSSKP